MRGRIRMSAAGPVLALLGLGVLGGGEAAPLVPEPIDPGLRLDAGRPPLGAQGDLTTALGRGGPVFLADLDSVALVAQSRSIPPVNLYHLVFARFEMLRGEAPKDIAFRLSQRRGAGPMPTAGKRYVVVAAVEDLAPVRKLEAEPAGERTGPLRDPARGPAAGPPRLRPPRGTRPAVNATVLYFAEATGENVAAVKKALGATPATQPQGAQGVKGQVVKLIGDFMPGPGPARGVRRPLAVPVHIFRGRIKPIERPDAKHPALVKIIQPDAEGRFAVALPPGEYTLVIEVGGRLYLNLYRGDGTWGSVTVKPDEWTTFNIEDSSEAAF